MDTTSRLSFNPITPLGALLDNGSDQWRYGYEFDFPLVHVGEEDFTGIVHIIYFTKIDYGSTSGSSG